MTSSRRPWISPSLRFLLFCLMSVPLFVLMWQSRETGGPSGDSAPIERSTASDPHEKPLGQTHDLSQPSVGKRALTVEASPVVTLVRQIIQSRNDNDPRLDSDLRTLSPEAREELRIEYAQTAPENRNARGTLVFLLGRNLETEADLAFMDSVLQEAPCRSLENCSVDEKTPESHGDSHADSLGTGVTLEYPQLNALLAIQAVLQRDPTHPLSSQMQALLRRALQSRHPMVAARAARILAGET